MNTTRTAAHPLDTFEGYLPADFDPALIVPASSFWRFPLTYKVNPPFEERTAVITLEISAARLPEDPSTLLVPGARLEGNGTRIPFRVHRNDPNTPTVLFPDLFIVHDCKIFRPAVEV